jgi:hypothetical protein
MSTQPAPTGGSTNDREVMASEDGEQFVIAEICRDDAWLSARREGALPLNEWR